MFYNEVFLSGRLKVVLKDLSDNDCRLLFELFIFMQRKMNFFLIRKFELRRFFHIIKKKHCDLSEGKNLFFLFDFFDVLLKNENDDSRILYNYFLYVLFFLLKNAGKSFFLCKTARKKNSEKEEFMKQFLIEKKIKNPEIVFWVIDESMVSGVQFYCSNCERYEFNYRRYVNDSIAKMKNLFFKDF